MADVYTSSPVYKEEEAMSVRFRDLSATEYWNLVWPFAAAFICGSILRWLAPICPWHGIPPDFVSAFADALMIAGILGLLLELFATRVLVEKVSGDLAEKLVGRGLPPELQTYIKTIVDTDIVRDRYTKIYKLSFPENQDIVQVDVTQIFEVRNYSDAVTEYAPIYQDEVFYDPQFKSLEYGLVGQTRLSETVEKRDASTKAITIKGKEKLRLQPFRREAKAVFDVIMR